MKKILLLEDNPDIVEGLCEYFKDTKFRLMAAESIREARKLLGETDDFKLAVLDIILPDGNGMSFFREDIQPKGIPAIFLTAKDTEDDIVEGLCFGAEDYVSKPFSVRELSARIERVIRRNEGDGEIIVENSVYDMVRKELKVDGKPIRLTPLELKLTDVLYGKKGTVISRELLIDYIWDWTGNDVDDHTVTVYINRIKKKMGADIIKTVKGIGYIVG